MRVWQPGTQPRHATASAQVEDWSWAATRRRLTALYRLARPYRLRTALAIVSLLAATAASLAPPLLIGRAVNDGQATATRTSSLWLVVGCSSPRASLGDRLLLRPDLLHRLDRRAHARRPAQPPLPPSAAALARLLRAQPRRRPDQPADQRRRGARRARHRRLHLADPEHAHAASAPRVHPLRPLLAARARDDDRAAGALGRDGDLPQEVEPLLPRRARDARRGHRDARRGHRRACACCRRSPASARRAQHFREVGETYRVKNQETVVQNALYFPFVDLLSSIATAIILGYGGYLVFDGQTTIGVLTAFLGYSANFFDPVQQLSQLYSTFLTAVAALDKIMEVLAEEPDVDRRARRARARPRARARALPTTSTSPTRSGAEVLHGIDLDVPPGTTVALVGHTGAGKSTIAKLIARFYDPTGGRDHDRRRRPAHACGRSRCAASSGSCRRRASSSPASLADNIAFGRPEATRAEIVAAAARRRRRRVRRRARRRATTPSSASAATASRSASASSSPSPARSSPTRAS